MSKYVNKFLNMKCAGDVIGIAGPMKKYEKEITEAMAMKEAIKEFALKKPNKYVVVDVCSGNALVPLLTAFTLPVAHSTAIDIKDRYRPWHLVNKFLYLTGDIKDDYFKRYLNRNPHPTILTACHACKNISEHIINLYHEMDIVKHLVLMPCCIGGISSKYSLLRQKLGKYMLWCLELADMCEGKVNIYQDNLVLSPKNVIITASK